MNKNFDAISGKVFIAPPARLNQKMENLWHLFSARMRGNNFAGK